MCEYFSCIITKDLKVHWIPENPRDHQAIIDKLRLEDKKLHFRDLVRIEITPKDIHNITRDPKDWEYKVDEPKTLPEWYIEHQKKAEKLCWQAWETSVKVNVALGDEERTVKDKGFLLASGRASIVASGSVSIVASGSVSIRAYGSVSIRAYDSVSIRAYDSVSIRASDSVSIEAYGSVSIRAYDSVSIRAYDSVSIRAYGSVSIVASGSVSIRAYDSVKFTLKSKTATAIKDGKIHVLTLSNVVEMKEAAK